MRRTHVMHKRDNRRSFPSHHDRDRALQDPRDPRELAWVSNGSAGRVMELDGRAVAEVMPFGAPRYDMLGEIVQPHTARILGTKIERECNTYDAARLFCERHFAAQRAA